MSYQREQLIDWITGRKQTFKSYLSDEFPAFDPRMSDDALNLYAVMVYNKVKEGQSRGDGSNGNGNGKYYLVPQVAHDGSVTYTDRLTGRVIATMSSTSDGLAVYFGDVDMIEKFFGRSALDRLNDRYKDRNFVHDAETTRRKAA